MFLHFFLQRPFQFRGAVQQLFHRPKVGYQLSGRLLTHARTTWEIVGRVAHEGQQVDNLRRRIDAILLANLFGAHHFVAAAMPWAIDAHALRYQLAIVFVGCQHESVQPVDRTGLFGECAHHVVGLEAVSLQDGYAVSLQDVFDDGHGALDIFWCGFTLRFVVWEGLAAEGRAVGVEGYADMCGLLLVEHLLQRVEKTHDGRCVEPLGIDAWVFDKGVIRPINERISV